LEIISTGIGEITLIEKHGTEVCFTVRDAAAAACRPRTHVP
jgi:hypothetical protein